eukprot:gene26890-32497_t
MNLPACPEGRPDLPRKSHADFFEARSWGWIESFWQRMVVTDSFPSFLHGTTPYSVTDLVPIHKLGLQEYTSNDPRYRRQTFALRISYLGSAYHGFQCQHAAGTQPSVATVEQDLKDALGRSIVAAGRTDRAVSAISQVISFSTYEPLSPADFLLSLRAHPNFNVHCNHGKLSVSQCVRVPRRFHALFSASWRRYAYLFPLNEGAYVQTVQGREDERTRSVDEAPEEVHVDVDIAFAQRCLGHIEGLVLHYNSFAHREQRGAVTGTEGPGSLLDEGGGGLKSSDDECLLYRCRASVVRLCEGLACCVELVGSRFLRRMVRILVATVLREATLPESVRDEYILLRLCKSGNRGHAALALPGVGLALAGVGYDEKEVGEYKHKPAGCGKGGRFHDDFEQLQEDGDSAADEDVAQDDCTASHARPTAESWSHDNSDIAPSSSVPKKVLSRRERKRKQSPTIDALPAHQPATESSSLFTYLASLLQSYAPPTSSNGQSPLMCVDPLLLAYPERLFVFPGDGTHSSAQDSIVARSADIVVTGQEDIVENTRLDGRISQNHDVSQLDSDCHRDHQSGVVDHADHRGPSANDDGFDVVLAQDGGKIEGTVWDAEVMLAYFLHHCFGCQHVSARSGPMSTVLELGAGRGLASLVLAKVLGRRGHSHETVSISDTNAASAHHAAGYGDGGKRVEADTKKKRSHVNTGDRGVVRILLQEKDMDMINLTLQGFESNGVHTTSGRYGDSVSSHNSSVWVGGVGGLWSVDLVAAMRSMTRTSHYSLILCSDVFYHPPFSSLLQTIYMCSDADSCVCIVVEKRRRDLEGVWTELSGMYKDCSFREVEVRAEAQEEDGDSNRSTVKVTTFMMRLYSGKIDGKKFK